MLITGGESRIEKAIAKRFVDARDSAVIYMKKQRKVKKDGR